MPDAPQPNPPRRDAPIRVIDLGRMPYADAYALQVAHHEEVLAARDAAARTPAEPGRVLLVEHDPPVITVSRRPGAEAHLLASASTLSAMGVQVEPTDRGGDITYHGPGQLVVYPILDLNALNLRLHDYMRLLEQAVIDTLTGYGVAAARDTATGAGGGATGVWVGDQKVCAMGVRIRRWVSMHGLALNITTDLSHFNLIVPCGLVGRGVTSLAQLLGAACPPMERVKEDLVERLRVRLTEHRPIRELDGL
jgi:lipoate-protein ligase B